MVNNIGDTETAAVKSGIFFPGPQRPRARYFLPLEFPPCDAPPKGSRVRPPSRAIICESRETSCDLDRHPIARRSLLQRRTFRDSREKLRQLLTATLKNCPPDIASFIGGT